MPHCEPLKKFFIAATMASVVSGCATTHITHETSSKGCWSGVDAVERTNNDNKEVRRAQVRTHWDRDCARFEKREAAKDVHYNILLARAKVEMGSPEQETQATRKMLDVISNDNPDLFIAKTHLNSEGVTAEQLLEREAASLLSRINSTTDTEDAQEARGELLSIYDGKTYPLHTKTARPIIDAALLKNGVELQDIKDVYLDKQEPKLSCKTINNTFVCNY